MTERKFEWPNRDNNTAFCCSRLLEEYTGVSWAEDYLTSLVGKIRAGLFSLPGVEQSSVEPGEWIN